MRNAAVIGQFERRLTELDCPPARLRHKVQELADHFEDLKQAAMEEGLSEDEAEARATGELGEPVTLAENAAAVLRQSSWWGRHRILAFCLLPPFAAFGIVGAAIALDFLAGHLYFPPPLFAIVADQPPDLRLMNFVLVYSSYLAIAVTAVLFCRLAGHSAAGLKAKLAACLVCSLYCYFVVLRVEPHALAYGFNFPPGRPNDWLPIVLPMVVGAAAVVRYRWRVGRLAPIPVPGPPGSRLIRPRREQPRTGMFTPTNAFLVVTAFGLAAGSRALWESIQKDRAHREELVTRTWPDERRAVIEQMQHHPIALDLARPVFINLKPFANATLEDSLAGRGDTNQNGLAGLRPGIFVYAGVPFDVEGRVQLLGRSLLGTAPTLPLRASGIRVGCKCNRIFLLHGASGIKAEMAGTSVAKLVLHYADGSRTTLPIVAGKDVLDWWGPLYQTEADERSVAPTSSDTELAWVGRNPQIELMEPHLSLRVYRTTLSNPHSELVVTSVDYESTGTEACPFLLGLTVD
jgi:hypothetical protein